MDSIHNSVESSHDKEAFTQSRNYEVGSDLKKELEHLKLEVAKETKDLLIKDINIFKDSFLKS